MTYQPPVRDLMLALAAAGHSELAKRHFSDLDPSLCQAVLEGAGAFAHDVFAPLNRLGDTVGARCENGRVTAPPGFAAAYRLFVEQGWNSLSADPEHGGQGLTKALELAVFEMLQAANMAFGLCPMLTQGAIEALVLHGNERQKRLVLPRLVSGEWTGTMNLTEPQSGSDLSALTTRAEPDGRGGYRLSGQKIFITWGDHEMTENICHLVLARTPDAPPGVRGISLFLATKRLIEDDGTTGGLNGIRPASIEHKLGIHASPTCVMLFEDARAELVGEPGRGLAHMFVMMNAARLQVGVQGVAIAERAFQQALAFSQDRRQGRSAWSNANLAAIYDHPDVRRMLVQIKARINAARGLCLTVGVLADAARLASDPEERAALQARQELLTPIAKAWATDLGVEAGSVGIQIHGGMGFVEETGAAQHFRDARIAPIYEGTNGIQAIDLVTRKVQADGGAAMRALCGEMTATILALRRLNGLASVGDSLRTAVTRLEQATGWILANPGPEALAAATIYLKLCGDVIGGEMLARQVLVAAGAEDQSARTSAMLLRQYASQVLTGVGGLADAVMEGAGDLARIPAEALAP